MEPMTDRNKAGWIIAFTLIGWVFFILPTSGGDFDPPTPISNLAWINWGIINVIALICVHLLISREARAEKRGRKTLRRVERKRLKIENRKRFMLGYNQITFDEQMRQARESHPTHHSYE